MQLIKRNFFIFVLVLILLLSLVTNWYYSLSVIFACMAVFTILDKLGKGIVLRELIVLHAVFVCLIMPIFGYEVYNVHNHLARIFKKYMFVSRDEYFGYVLPAIAAFSVAICWPITQKGHILDEGVPFQYLLSRIKKILIDNVSTGLYIIGIGIVMFYMAGVVPEGLRFFTSLFYSGCFAGVLYVFYSPFYRYKNLVLLFFTLFIVYTAVQSGVFTIVAYMGITLFSFFFIGKKQRFWKKLLVCLVCIFFLFLLQNVKSAYRRVTWNNGAYAGNKTQLFTDIAEDKLMHLDDLFDVISLFPIYSRTNQGYNVALVMRRIPAYKDFDHGKRLGLVAASSLVPRILWPNKPEAGGKESMLYFTGYRISGWSTNVSPIGEGYGSFGPIGGIVFMFVLGSFVRWAYLRVFQIAWRLPLLVLWIPVLFFQITYSMETDTLQILNSLLKSAFFIWLLYKTVPEWFGIKKATKPWRAVKPNQHIPV